jgi:hypothetical protein
VAEAVWRLVELAWRFINSMDMTSRGREAVGRGRHKMPWLGSASSRSGWTCERQRRYPRGRRVQGGGRPCQAARGHLRRDIYHWDVLELVNVRVTTG